MEKPRLIPVGRIARPHGVRGAVKIYPYGETLATGKAGDKFYAPSSPLKDAELTLVNLWPQGRLWVGEFAELTNRDAAQSLAGVEICIPEALLPPLEEGEYYYYQLIGLTVETRSGERVGTVRDIIETGASDIYVAENDGKEVLIPAVEEVVYEVDLETGRIIIDPPEGLIDGL
jgi:16S rRNA processing protein RimM